MLTGLGREEGWLRMVFGYGLGWGRPWFLKHWTSHVCSCGGTGMARLGMDPTRLVTGGGSFRLLTIEGECVILCLWLIVEGADRGVFGLMGESRGVMFYGDSGWARE